MRAGRHELNYRDAVWGELERRGATVATVPFSERAARGRERAEDRAQLAYALEAPVWDRYGTFAGQPRVHGTVVWSLSDRSVVIVGERGGERFEEAIA